MTTTAIELESVHETEIPCQKLIANRINKGVSGDITFTKVQLLRFRQRVVSTSYDKSELECNSVISSDSLF